MIPFALPALYPILDTGVLARCEISPVQAAEVLLEAGVEMLQFRHKEAWTQTEFDQASEIAKLARGANAVFVVNDRADYAALLGAAVHVGQNDLPPAAVRRVVRDLPIGYSTHNAEQMRLGDMEDVQYLALGPIYKTNSKLNPDPEVGTSGLRRLRDLTRKPLVAIGGITLENATETLEAGADSVAVIGALFQPDCTLPGIRTRAEEWLRLLSKR